MLNTPIQKLIAIALFVLISILMIFSFIEPSGANNSLTQAAIPFHKGDYAEAVPLLETHLRMFPNDMMAQELLRASQHRINFADNKQEQQELQRMVHSLIQKRQTDMQEQDAITIANAEWTSPPLHVLLMDVEGLQNDAHSVESAFLPLGLQRELIHQHISIVQREYLLEVLHELQLGSSILTDPNERLRIGKMLAARALIIPKIVKYDTQMLITIEIINTESSEIVGLVEKSVKKDARFTDVVQLLGLALVKELNLVFPRRSSIRGILENGSMQLDNGSLIGWQVGMCARQRDSTDNATLEITHVQEQSAIAIGNSWAVGTKVEQISCN
ncbi:MAG: CsgG/HfaB family protein [Mariprofundales bacterium]